MPNPSNDYQCPRCNYLTPRRYHMLNHFEKLKAPCPDRQGIILTDDIKKYVLKNHVYIRNHRTASLSRSNTRITRQPNIVLHNHNSVNVSIASHQLDRIINSSLIKNNTSSVGIGNTNSIKPVKVNKTGPSAIRNTNSNPVESKNTTRPVESHCGLNTNLLDPCIINPVDSDYTSQVDPSIINQDPNITNQVDPSIINQDPSITNQVDLDHTEVESNCTDATDLRDANSIDPHNVNHSHCDINPIDQSDANSVGINSSDTTMIDSCHNYLLDRPDTITILIDHGGVDSNFEPGSNNSIESVLSDTVQLVSPIEINETLNQIKQLSVSKWTKPLEAMSIKCLIQSLKNLYFDKYELYLIRHLQHSTKDCVKLREHLDIYYKFIGAFDLDPAVCVKTDDKILGLDPSENSEYNLAERYYLIYLSIKNFVKTAEKYRIKKTVADLIKNGGNHNLNTLTRITLELICAEGEFYSTML